MNNFIRFGGIFFIAFFLLFSFFKINGFFSNKNSSLIKADGLGYYSYLPAMFIYGDYTQGFVAPKVEKYYDDEVPEYMERIHDRPVDKYFFGTAVMMYPFFMTAHWITLFLHKPADGYSLLYQYFIGLAAIFYLLLGIFFCDRLMRNYGAKAWQSMFICILLALATNLYFYAVVECSMSHAFSFCAIAAFLFFSKRTFTGNHKYIIPACIAFGLIVLIRPINGLIILTIPFIAGDLKSFWEGIKFLFRHYVLSSLGVLCFFLIVSLQLIIWYKQTGHFLIYSYTYERFYFDRPHVMDVLFSYQKGIFIYTPLCFIALAGFYFYFKEKKFAAISLFIFFALLIYIFSCWHSWYYGSSFGFRPFIEFLPLISLLLLFIIQNLKRPIFKFLFVVICLSTLYLNQLQAYQYRKFILHWDHMSEYKYWRVFLRTDPLWSGYVWNNPDPADFYGNQLSSYITNFEKELPQWVGGKKKEVKADAHSGTKISILDNNEEYSTTFFLQGDSISTLINCNKPAVIFSGYLHAGEKSNFKKLHVIVSYHSEDGQAYYYRSRFVDDLHKDKNGWQRFDLAMKLEKIKSKSDILKIYIWNPAKEIFWIDDVSVNFFELTL